MSWLLDQLIVAPVVLPLATAALLVLLGEKRKRARPLVNVLSTALGLGVAVALLRRVDGGGAGGEMSVYLASNWQAPFGIVLVADRLSALMLVLVGVLGFCVALYAEAGWARAGVYFHALFQVQLMGLNGAFLTGDLFNLFVFFEVMLAASYGLQLHGSGWPRVRSGLHYIAVNLLASVLFLVGLAVIYGVMGTLSMADVAAKLGGVAEADRGLLQAGITTLAVAFLVKAAAWPVNAWLVPAYAAASAPVAALFAIMTKVGVYTLLRLWTLFFSEEGSVSAGFGSPFLFYGGLATIAFGVLGVVASLRLGRIAAFSIIVSSGTLLAALGIGDPEVTGAALFYLLSATLAVGGLFLLVELMERIGVRGAPRLRDVDVVAGEDTNLDDEEMPLVGRTVPASLALLGISFMTCTVLVAGLPPLSGFLAKFSLLKALLGEGQEAVSPQAWVFFGLLLFSGLAATIALARVGIRHLWTSGCTFVPYVSSLEAAAVVTLLVCSVGLTAGAEPVLRYAKAAAASLHAPQGYIETVLSARARPGVNHEAEPMAQRAVDGEGTP